MSNITALQAPGTGVVQPAKPTVSPVPDASKTSFSPDAGATALDPAKVADPARQPVPIPGFQSPTTRIDPQNNAVILEYRDGQSGELLRQLPTKAQLRLYELNQEAKSHDSAQIPAAGQAAGIQGQAGPAGADALGPGRTVSEA